ncbi:MAG: hypothetical protein ACAI35_06650 [Candidatus Methylacidiphilales bacterium]|nr:hypothetical protein [Candidatus Methylacidiphilales bacterium]
MNFQLLGGVFLIGIAAYVAFANLKATMWPAKIGTWMVHTVAFANEFKTATACILFALGVALIVTIQKN